MNVLESMDEAAYCLSLDERDVAQANLLAARAAVAELIGDVAAFISDHDHGLGPDIGRLRAALKAVQP